MTDHRPRLSPAGRVALALAALLALASSGGGLQPATSGGPPAEPGVQEGPQRPHGLLGGHLPLVMTKGGHGQRHRRGDVPVGVPAAALAGTLAGAMRRPRTARSRHLEPRRPALGSRAPPFRS